MDKICILMLVLIGWKMKLFPWQFKRPKKIIKFKGGIKQNGKLDYGKANIINIEELRENNENRTRHKAGL